MWVLNMRGGAEYEGLLSKKMKIKKDRAFFCVLNFSPEKALYANLFTCAFLQSAIPVQCTSPVFLLCFSIKMNISSCFWFVSISIDRRQFVSLHMFVQFSVFFLFFVPWQYFCQYYFFVEFSNTNFFFLFVFIWEFTILFMWLILYFLIVFISYCSVQY